MKLTELLKKITTAFLALLIALTATYAPLTQVQVPRAHALWGILDTNITDIIEFILNAIAWAIAKMAIRSLTKTAVEWINSGFEGEPGFITDLEQNMRRVGDSVAAEFVSTYLTKLSIDSPQLNGVLGNVALGYLLYTNRDAITERLRSTLREYTNNEVAFLRGDFSQGGLNAWMSVTWTCANDINCAEFAAQEALVNRIDDKMRADLEVASWGNGFLSWRGDCAPAAPKTGKDPSVPLNDADSSTGCPVRTPGSMIEDMLISDVKSPLNELQIADSFNEIIGALASQLMNKVLGGGGLLGVSRPQANTGRSYLEDATAANQAGNTETLSSGFENTISSERTRVVTYQQSWDKIYTAAQRAVAACGSNGNEASRTYARNQLAAAEEGRERAAVAVARVNALQSRIAAVRNQPADLRTAAVAKLTEEYQCLLAGKKWDDTLAAPCVALAAGETADLPDGNESAYAMQQSQDSGDTVYANLTRIDEEDCENGPYRASQ